MKMRIHRTSSKLQQLIALAGLLICVIVGSIRLSYERYYTWAEISDGGVSQASSTKDRINRLLLAITKADEPVPGGQANLVTLRTSGRQQISVLVVEGDLQDSTIDPSITWKNILGTDRGYKALLLNSVDEMHRNNGGISEHIAKGCEFPALTGEPVQIGDLDITQCRGPYRKEFGIDLIASAAIVVWTSYGEKNPCEIPIEAPESDQAYSECIAPQIRKALKKLFDNLRARPKDETLHTFVLPAIGTGLGHASKEDFYQALKGQLLAELQVTDDKNVLPENIVLQVWRSEDPERWIASRQAIANAISELHDEWITQDHKSSSVEKLAGFVGVSGMLFTIVLSLLVGLRIPHGFASEYRLLTSGPILLVLLGWGLASFGLYDGIQQFVFWLTSYSSSKEQIICGAVGVLACGVLFRAKSAFDEKKFQRPSLDLEE